MKYIELTPDSIKILKEQLEPLQPPMETMQEKLIKAIEESIGQDLDNSVPNDVACVTQLVKVLQKIMEFPNLSYTPVLVRTLKADNRFKGTLDLDVGNIIVNATGTGNGMIIGHCGFIWKDGKIVSNKSSTGKLDTHFTIETWKQRYRIKGEMPTLVFQLLIT